MAAAKKQHLIVVACIKICATVPEEVDHLDGTMSGSLQDCIVLEVLRELCTVRSKQVEEDWVMALNRIVKWLKAPSALTSLPLTAISANLPPTSAAAQDLKHEGTKHQHTEP
jgi:hypothetical protein